MELRCLRRRVRPVLAAALCAPALFGCAYTYIDADGNRNAIGFVHLTVPPTTPEPKAADWMRLRTFGFVLSRTDIGSALEVGYADSTLAAVRNNKCIPLDSLPPVLIATSGDADATVATTR
jgi:hypothetical protein